MFGVGAAMFAAAVATGAAHGPRSLSVVFVVLMVVFGVVGFTLGLVGAAKSRAETQRLVAQAAERTRRAKRD
jgi:hypothetical protein